MRKDSRQNIIQHHSLLKGLTFTKSQHYLFLFPFVCMGVCILLVCQLLCGCVGFICLVMGCLFIMFVLGLILCLLSPFHTKAIQQGSFAKLCKLLQNVPCVKGQQLCMFFCKVSSNIATFYNQAKTKQGTPVKLLSCEQHSSVPSLFFYMRVSLYSFFLLSLFI